MVTLFLISAKATEARKLSALFDYARFKYDDKLALLELYFDVEARTMHLMPVSNKANAMRRGAARITVDIYQDNALAFHDDFRVSTPLLRDSTAGDLLLSAISRAAIPAKASEVRLKLFHDNVNDPDTVNFSLNVDLSKLMDKGPIMSDIQWARSVDQLGEKERPDDFTKSGIRLKPYPSDYYGAENKTIKSYVEIYGLNNALPDTNTAVLTYRILKLPTFELLEEFGGIKRVKPAQAIPVFKQIDISELPSGQYRLQLALVGPGSKILALQDKNFFKSNPLFDKDKTTSETGSLVNTKGTFVDTIQGKVIKQYVTHLAAIATRAEIGTIDLLSQGTDYVAMRSFYLEFWQRRNKQDPFKEHREYRRLVKEAYEKYGLRSKPLLESARARVWLRYGEPNQILNEASDPMRQYNVNQGMLYEVWRYFNLERTGQTDVEFVFIRDEITSQFTLVHSNAQGERRNDTWRQSGRTGLSR